MNPLIAHEGHDHHPSIQTKRAVADSIWEQEHIELVTVGIDIGSSTSHLIFAKVHLQRRTQGLSSRYEVIKREILWQSPISFTPFLDNGLIDSGSLGSFIEQAYFDAGLHKHDVDSGAVILTGEAIKRSNAKAIDELFAKQAGKFVCATAGHRLECVLAAHGSGAVERSRRFKTRILHIDIGGGTTKLALIDAGKIVSIAAYAVGGRLMATDHRGDWVRCDESIHLVCDSLGMEFEDASEISDQQRQQIVASLAEVLIAVVSRSGSNQIVDRLLLTEPLSWTVVPDEMSFSGGVSEFIYGRETEPLGDLAFDLANELMNQLENASNVPEIVDSQYGIRATVIGASQFTVQVSGKTIFADSLDFLPLRNVPVIHLDTDLSLETIDVDVVSGEIIKSCRMRDVDRDNAIALSFEWQGDPSYQRLKAIADAIDQALCCPERKAPLVIVIDGDVGRLLGRILSKELNKGVNVLSLDGVVLSDLDFIDVGEMISPPGVIPLVIKSLVFDSTQHAQH